MALRINRVTDMASGHFVHHHKRNTKGIMLLRMWQGVILALCHKCNIQTEITGGMKMKRLNDQFIIGVDHGYGNILCKEIYNPDILQKAMHCSGFCEEMSGLLFI